jgi:hypothetical protein
VGKNRVIDGSLALASRPNLPDHCPDVSAALTIVAFNQSGPAWDQQLIPDIEGSTPKAKVGARKTYRYGAGKLVKTPGLLWTAGR